MNKVIVGLQLKENRRWDYGETNILDLISASKVFDLSWILPHMKCFLAVYKTFGRIRPTNSIHDRMSSI